MIVKHVAEELKAKTLGQLQKELKAGTKMKPTDADKAKHALAERIGVNATVKLLRAVTSFTGQRKAKLPPARGKKAEAPATPEHPYNWRLLPIKEVVSQKAAEALEKVDVKTVSDFQTFLDKLMEKQPKDNTEKHYVRDRLVEQLLLPTDAAQKLMDNVSDYMKANIKPKKS